MIAILILAAGRSRRMRGTDKLAQCINGVPMLRRIASEAARVGQTYVALPIQDSNDRLAMLDGLAVTPLPIPESAEGQSATLRGAMTRLPACDAVLVVLADLPRITAGDMQAVLDARKRHPDALIWRGATADGRPGHPILFDAALRPLFAELTGDDGGAAVVRPRRDRTVLIPFSDDRALFDLDTPEDWAAYRASGDEQA